MPVPAGRPSLFFLLPEAKCPFRQEKTHSFSCCRKQNTRSGRKKLSFFPAAGSKIPVPAGRPSLFFLLTEAECPFRQENPLFSCLIKQSCLTYLLEHTVKPENSKWKNGKFRGLRTGIFFHMHRKREIT
ncbi:MAG: hypothetical protein IJS22_01695 [Lachnospiraceae bacterium]|nr:hypothetical protein [Lachnospiraceae bacterium]